MRNPFRFGDTSSFRSATEIVIIGTSSYWLAYSLFRETSQAFYNMLSRGKPIAEYVFNVLINFTVIVIPLLLLLLFIRSIIRHRKLPGRHLSVYKIVRGELNGNAGIFLFLSILFAPFYLFLEDYSAFSVTPLVTPLCAVLGIIFGYYIVRQLDIRDRLMTLALLSSLILGTKYVDWNPRKPLIRDMYRIEAGMTFDEVDKIMSRHKHPRGSESYDNFEETLEEKDEAAYMTATTADIVSVKFQDGKVATIKFSHD